MPILEIPLKVSLFWLSFRDRERGGGSKVKTTWKHKTCNTHPNVKIDSIWGIPAGEASSDSGDIF